KINADQKPAGQFEKFVVQFEFLRQIRAVYEHVKMIGLRQCRIVWVAPAFRIEMQTKHKIGMQFEVHQRSPPSNLAVTVKQNFALPANGLLFGGIIWIENIRARLWHAVLN